MKVDVKETSAWARRLTITVPNEAIQKERQAVARKLAKRLKLPGFRKGKIPPDFVEKRYGPAIEQETIERVVNNAYRDAIRERELQPINQGTIDNVDYEAGQDLTFDVEFEVRPEIELSRVGGFQAKRPKADIGDEQVDRVLERLREDRAVWRPVEEADAIPEIGDMVGVAITPVPEEPDEEQAPEPRSYEIVLGDGQALPAIEDAIQTLSPGQEEQFTIEVPEEPDEGEDPENVVMKPHTVRIKLDTIKRPEMPALDDAFAAMAGDFDDLGALRDRVRQDLEKEASSQADHDVRRQLMDQLLEANPFEVPASMVNDYLDRVIQPQDEVDEAELAEARASAQPAAERAIKRLMAVERIAETEGLHATRDDVEARLSELAERFGQDVGELRKRLTDDGRIQQLVDEITEDKVYAYLESVSEVE